MRQRRYCSDETSQLILTFVSYILSYYVCFQGWLDNYDAANGVFVGVSLIIDFITLYCTNHKSDSDSSRCLTVYAVSLIIDFIRLYRTNHTSDNDSSRCLTVYAVSLIRLYRTNHTSDSDSSWCPTVYAVSLIIDIITLYCTNHTSDSDSSRCLTVYAVNDERLSDIDSGTTRCNQMLQKLYFAEYLCKDFFVSE